MRSHSLELVSRREVSRVMVAVAATAVSAPLRAQSASPRQRRQACNVVQARPGRVVAYAGNPASRAALEADGIGVDAFEVREPWAWHGGPHCLTQPLERG